MRIQHSGSNVFKNGFSIQIILPFDASVDPYAPYSCDICGGKSYGGTAYCSQEICRCARCQHRHLDKSFRLNARGNYQELARVKRLKKHLLEISGDKWENEKGKNK